MLNRKKHKQHLIDELTGILCYTWYFLKNREKYILIIVHKQYRKIIKIHKINIQETKLSISTVPSVIFFKIFIYGRKQIQKKLWRKTPISDFKTLFSTIAREDKCFLIKIKLLFKSRQLLQIFLYYI